MPQHDDTESELLEWIEELQQEVAALRLEKRSLRQQVLVAESVIPKYQEALDASQFELWKTQALLNISNQPTA
ncbi:hypothetical protein ACIOTN_17190 [Glutamicibacter sp. NPDC087661]|uniref:hypothetical protein n=1 Tax=Glutamicibacter sp. NPDC087661 TaxID=3363996 RepID=UPI00380E3C25